MKVLQDGVEIINQEIDKFSNEKAGNVGMRLWGKVSENYDCAFKIDNVKTGKSQKKLFLHRIILQLIMRKPEKKISK